MEPGRLDTKWTLRFYERAMKRTLFSPGIPQDLKITSGLPTIRPVLQEHAMSNQESTSCVFHGPENHVAM